MTHMLELKELHYYYGKIEAVKGISLHVDPGEIVALIGANGAGKTTTLRCVSGLLGSSHTGGIEFLGQDISRKMAHEITRLGLIHVLEGRKIFPHLTVLENLRMGAYCRKDRENFEADIAEMYRRFPRLQERSRQLAGTLSGGEQQMLAISRALMARPSLLLLDEPSLGLAPIIIQQIFAIIHKVNANGTTVFLVEQNANQALRIAHRGYVMENGRISMEGLAEDLLQSPEVRSAYLGM